LLKFAKVSSPPEYQLNQHASFSVASASLSGAESFTIPKSYAYTVHQSSEGEVWDYSVTGTLTATFAPLAFTLGEAAAGNRAVASGVTRAAGGVGPYQVTFSADNPGAVSVPMDMVAATFPDATMVDWVGKHAEWEISPIGDSHDAATYTSLDWDTSVLGDALTGEGDSPVATFTGLPLYNKDFGNKVVMMTLRDPNDGHAVLLQKAGWQVFFPRDASNNPGQRALPNWYEYWLQTTEPWLETWFRSQAPSGAALPTYELGPNSQVSLGDTVVYLSVGDREDYLPPYGVKISGIDNFTWTLVHETQHYADYLRYWQNDPILWASLTNKTGPNGDNDGDKLPNFVEDSNLNGVYNRSTDCSRRPISMAECYDWGVKLTAQNPPPDNMPYNYNDFEDANCYQNRMQVGDHSADWANPGFKFRQK